jgi:hypothetical protein
LVSGAEKTYSATSNVIDTLNAFWDGSADGPRFFIANEKVLYTISFLGSSIKYSDTLHIKNSSDGPMVYVFDFFKKQADGSKLTYWMVDDMGDTQYSSGLGNTGIRTSYSDAADGNGEAKFFVTTNTAVDGHLSYYMIGTDFNQNTYLGGASGQTLNELYYATSSSDPSKVYINAYIYGYGRANSTLTFQLFENDSWNPGNAIPAARPPALTNDMWSYMVQVDWVGWKLVSIPYSSFKCATNVQAGGGGNKIAEPQKFAGFGIELDSYPVGGSTVELSLDAVYITTNGPFIP